MNRERLLNSLLITIVLLPLVAVAQPTTLINPSTSEPQPTTTTQPSDSTQGILPLIPIKPVFIERLYAGVGCNLALMSRSYIRDNDTNPVKAFTGYGCDQNLGLHLPKGIDLELLHVQGSVRGQVLLPTAIPEFLASVNSDPNNPYQLTASSLGLQTPRADLRLRQEHWAMAIAWEVRPFLHLQKILPQPVKSLANFKIVPGGGPARTCTYHATKAKTGIPNGISFDQDTGAVAVTTGGLRDTGEECNWTGVAELKKPFTLYPGIELGPEYRYIGGQHQVLIHLDIVPFGVGKKYAY